MNSRRLFILFLLLTITLAVFALIKSPSTKTVRAEVPRQSALSQSGQIPEFVAYGFMFRLVSRLSDKTSELRHQGRIGNKEYYPLQREASLTQAQAKILEAIASVCQREVAQRDEKAKTIVQSFRAQFPDGKIPQGKTLPPPPTELKALSDERTAIILKAREQLRAALGQESFTRFDQYVKFRYGRITPQSR